MSILRATLQPVLGPVLAPVGEWVRDGDPLTRAVLAMFANAEKGVMFDLSRKANLYQDSARTTLVDASGDRIGSATDLSPNGKHASSAGTARPIWNSGGYGTFDALDDYLQTAAIDFTATDAVTVVASIRKDSDAASGSVVVLTGTSNRFYLRSPRSGVDNSFFSAGSETAEARGTGPSAPVAMVLTGQAKISTDSCILRLNGAANASSSTDQGTGNYGNAALILGTAGSSIYFNGRIYRVLVIGRTLTTTELATAERWAAQPAGVVIP